VTNGQRPILEHPSLRHGEADRVTWNALAERVGETSYYHSWDWLNYMRQFPGLEAFEAEIETDADGIPVAVFVAGAMRTAADGQPALTFPGGPLGVPALASMPASLRRRTRGRMIERLREFAADHRLRGCVLASHPLTVNYGTEASGLRNFFEYGRYGFVPVVHNTVVLDLRVAQEELRAEVSRYHLRHIERQARSGDTVRAFSGSDDLGALEQWMTRFRAVHRAAAGGSTRREATWQAMLHAAAGDAATLFVNFVADRPASYLFCGEYARMAFGWSQANDPRFEDQRRPLRHLLEWEAILAYRRRGLAFYELGDRPFALELPTAPSAKELSIGAFKERYGGFLLPKVQWLAHADADGLRGEFGGWAKGLPAMVPWLSEAGE
jgi:hypothetical protein